MRTEANINYNKDYMESDLYLNSYRPALYNCLYEMLSDTIDVLSSLLSHQFTTFE